MGIIEEAAKRLEQLRSAGVELPDALGARALSREPARPTGAVTIPPDGTIASLPLQETWSAATPPALLRTAPGRVAPPRPASSSKPAQKVTIALDKLRLAEMVAPDSTASRIADEFRVIKRPLIQNAKGRSASKIENANLIMVTSSVAGEGKSFVALNLAMSIAMEMDSRVLLIDADVVAPSLPDLLGISAQRGLMDLLTVPGTDFSDVLLKTNVDRLSVILAGTPHESAAEYLASQAMVELLDEIAKRYSDRIVVFDSPPLLATTESRVLATHMGQVVMVVEAERTAHAIVKHALATVEACPIVMTVLNKAARPELGAYYGYPGNH